MVIDPIQGKLASSQFYFGYTEQFCIPGVTSVFLSSCDSVVGDSLEFNQANRGSLRVCFIGKTQLLWTQCRGIGPDLAGRGKSHGFSRVADRFRKLNVKSNSINNEGKYLYELKVEKNL